MFEKYNQDFNRLPDFKRGARIVFWNLNRKSLTTLVTELVQVNEADVLILAECSAPAETTLEALRLHVDPMFFMPRYNSNGRFHCYCRNSELDLTEVHSGFRTSVRKLRIGSTSALLGIVHGVDIRNYDPESRQAAAQALVDEVSFVKNEQDNNRLILMGDFNMNPYDRGMNLPMGFNAMMTKTCVEREQRTFLGKKYDLYYNPMWSLFGDGTAGPAGTCYNTSNQGPYGWSMLDQVILNYSIVPSFGGVQILTHAGNHCLIDAKGRPNASVASDHLPILVEIKK
ncbi:MAG: endonuclease/exonuclease/phosphatase family protein [Luteolibacter sp.]